MPDNQGLSHLSDHFLIVAVVLYSLAVIAFAADFAFGRRSPVVIPGRDRRAPPGPATVGAGASAVDAGAATQCAAPVPWTVRGAMPLRWAPASGGGWPASGAEPWRGGQPPWRTASAGQPRSGRRAAGGSGVGPRPAGPLRRAPGGLVRIALILTTAGLALHITGIITRGLAVHRVPWGDMYEFIIGLVHRRPVLPRPVASGTGPITSACSSWPPS